MKHCPEDTRILDIGSGSYSYLPSVAFDCSEKMLAFNDMAREKVRGELEETWPFTDASFDFVTAVFVLNYLDNLDFVFSEARRVLDNGGKFFVVLSATGVSELHQKHEKQQHDLAAWKRLLAEAFDSVESYEKEGVWFFVCAI